MLTLFSPFANLSEHSLLLQLNQLSSQCLCHTRLKLFLGINRTLTDKLTQATPLSIASVDLESKLGKTDNIDAVTMKSVGSSSLDCTT